jgi:hypothetical protein
MESEFKYQFVTVPADFGKPIKEVEEYAAKLSLQMAQEDRMRYSIHRPYSAHSSGKQSRAKAPRNFARHGGPRHTSVNAASRHERGRQCAQP